MKREKTAITILVLLGACLAIGTAIRRQKTGQSEYYVIPEEKQLTVYTSHKREVYLPIIEEFQERTGICVEVRQGDTYALLEEIAAGKECDVMFGGGIESFYAYHSLLLPYQAKGCESFISDCAPEDYAFTPFSILPVVLIYNNKLLSPEEAPQSFAELMTPAFQGNIAFGDPEKSGSCYTALCTFLQLTEGSQEEKIRRFVLQLGDRVQVHSGDILEAVHAGKKAVGITLEETAQKKISQGDDLAIVYPREGTSAIPDATAIIRRCRHPENARAFVDFTVSQDVQRFLAETCFRRSIRRDLETLQDIAAVKRMDYDVEEAVRNKEEILSLWKEYYGEGGYEMD